MTQALPKRKSMGITLRTALFSWLVAVATLVIFVVFIIPQQKRTFELNLRSKAQALVASVHGVAAGAVVNEDYPTLVDHGLSVLSGDKTIDYLVLVKNDGTAQVWQQVAPKWNPETLDERWRPAVREPSSGIGVVPRFQQRVFHFSQPFDYSGIQWGWIHVGLSLESYDRSVAEVYQRTGLLAVLCVALSLLASVVNARKLVRPVLTLRTAVEKIAGGDLSARVAIGRGDELGSLAVSVNLMTEALLRRDQILQSVRFTAQQFLSTVAWQAIVDEVLANMGRAARLARVCLFRNELDPDGTFASRECHAWTMNAATGANPPEQGPRFAWSDSGFEAWEGALRHGEMLAPQASAMPPLMRQLAGQLGLRVLAVLPIRAEGEWWGFLCFAAPEPDRVWTDAERDSFRAVADMLGSAIARQCARDALVEAKEGLEQRVIERTRELREQIAAKEQAHADLAEAQQSLMDVSRRAGMAEVATGVLHNVGNVLNSVNVSCNLVQDRVRRSELAGLSQLVTLLETHDGHLAEFFARDPRGRQVPGYLRSLAQVLSEEHSLTLEELNSLRDRIDHIKEIVAMQQDYARIAGVMDLLSVTQLTDDAIKLNSGALARHGITVVRHYAEVPRVTTDKHKVLQILLNLIRNAKYACDEGGAQPKVLTLRVARPQPDFVHVQVADNGVGIPPENLVKIFSHGFTTRQEGHGFGLHSAALAARELGGSLTVTSPGPGLGATFTLQLPCEPSAPQ